MALSRMPALRRGNFANFSEMACSTLSALSARSRNRQVGRKKGFASSARLIGGRSFLAPLPGLAGFGPRPSAHALGYCLAPLRG